MDKKLTINIQRCSEMDYVKLIDYLMDNKIEHECKWSNLKKLASETVTAHNSKSTAPKQAFRQSAQIICPECDSLDTEIAEGDNYCNNCFNRW